VEAKSKKQDDRSIVYMIMLKEDVNAVAGMTAADMTKAKSFLNNLLPHVEAANLELMILAQEEVIAKAEKKLKNLQDDKISMEDKIKKLQDSITDNVKTQEETTKDIENQRAALENLKKKRVSN
jgi:peptidoglycan hydrolase CwlO-like protein